MCSGEQKVFDAEATQKYIREQIVDWRRTYSSSAKGKKEAARRTWVDVEDIECPTTFSEWAENQKLFDEAWEMSVYGPGRRTIEFKALYELFWPMLCEALGKELESEQAAEVGVGAAE
jgi:hypothetical protein